MSTASSLAAAGASSPPPSRSLQVTHALLYLSAGALYLWSIGTQAAMLSAGVALVLAMLLAARGHRRGLRLPAALLIAVGSGALAFPLGRGVIDSVTIAGVLGPVPTLLLGDVLIFGLLTFGVVFGLRTLGAHHRVFATLELVFVVGGVAHVFATHRNQFISRPRAFSDWAWTRGIDPQILLHAAGVAVAAVAAFMLLRRARWGKLMATLVALLLIGGVVYWWARDLRIDTPIDTNGLGLTSGEQDAKGDESGRGGGAAGDRDGEGGAGKDGEGKDGSGQRGGGSSGRGSGQGSGQGDGQGSGRGDGGGGGGTPPPVMVAVFHEDHEPDGGLLYFRQQVLSRYDGHKLVADDGGRDRDMIAAFPREAPLLAEEPPVATFHLRVPTSVFLLADHPQPPALTGAFELHPRPNPAPRRFVAAYDVVSYVLSQQYTRLIGRPSVPPEWDADRREHYLQTPDDPRYHALAAELVRGVDPRFVGEDLIKALAIKRYLEVEGFYTRKERHVDQDDPAASFLFGSLRGYCVHFAHAAVHLMRSQGIAARVALGYAVPMHLRGAGSAVLVTADRAHAWPEIHISGVGWVPFDIYPEQSDEPAPQLIDQDLENLLGELARDDASGGKSADPFAEPWDIPWARIALTAAWALFGLLVLAWLIKLGRRELPLRAAFGDHRLVYAGTLDRFSDIGAARRVGETRERHAARLSGWAPSVIELTRLHLRAALGGPQDVERMRALARSVADEYARSVGWPRRVWSWINPLGWIFTR